MTAFLTSILFFMFNCVCGFIVVLTILNRILKIYMIAPFAGLALSTGSGRADGTGGICLYQNIFRVCLHGASDCRGYRDQQYVYRYCSIGYGKCSGEVIGILLENGGGCVQCKNVGWCDAESIRTVRIMYVMYIDCMMEYGWEEINLYGIICLSKKWKIKYYIVVPYVIC